MYTTTEDAAHFYPDEKTILENRARYFEANGFGDGGYSDTWVTLKEIWGFRIGIPNTAGRVRAVRLHDIHHVLAGYGTNWTGEAEIGAFEIGAGCGDHYAAWVLNGSTLVYGIVIAPRKVFRAFVRGRHATSLYSGEWRDSILDENTGKLRSELRIGPEVPVATFSDVLAFGVVMTVVLSVAVSPLLLVGSLLSLAR